MTVGVAEAAAITGFSKDRLDNVPIAKDAARRLTHMGAKAAIVKWGAFFSTNRPTASNAGAAASGVAPLNALQSTPYGL